MANRYFLDHIGDLAVTAGGRSLRRGDRDVLLARGSDGVPETAGVGIGDLEAGLVRIDADRADFLLGDDLQRDWLMKKTLTKETPAKQ